MGLSKVLIGHLVPWEFRNTCCPALSQPPSLLSPHCANVSGWLGRQLFLPFLKKKPDPVQLKTF